MPRDFFYFFFFNDTATTEIYTLSLHDALPTWSQGARATSPASGRRKRRRPTPASTISGAGILAWLDRKSTRLNSSHTVISYAVFCLKKKKKKHSPSLPETKTR